MAATLTLAAAGCASHPASPGGSAAGTAGVDLTGTIPWLDAPTQPPLAPTPSPAPSRPTDARACTATDVTARLDGRNGAGGHAITYVQFRNTSTSPCVLSGYPHVTVTEPGLPTVAGSNGSFFHRVILGHARGWQVDPCSDIA